MNLARKHLSPQTLPASPWFWMALFVLAILIALKASPVERVLGASARIVYLHGAWIWAAMLTLLASAFIGLLALILRRQTLHGWSRAAGRSGLLLWTASLPLSLYLMQASWNGLFLLEPRWRIPLTFVIAGLLLQIGLSLFPASWASPANIVYAIAFWFAMQSAGDVLHPDSPIFTSDSTSIKIFFFILVILLGSFTTQVTRLFHRLEHKPG